MKPEQARNGEVAIVQRRLPHYRVPLFEQLRERLQADGIRLRLLHGEPTEAEQRGAVLGPVKSLKREGQLGGQEHGQERQRDDRCPPRPRLVVIRHGAD